MRTQANVINLYKDKETDNIKHVVSIADEEDLNQFWIFLTNYHNDEDNMLETFLAQFYNLSLSYLLEKDSEFFEIILEDSTNYFYFSIWNKRVLPIFEDYAIKASLEYLSDNKRISIRLDKIEFQKNLKKITKKNKKREKNLLKSSNEDKAIVKKQKVYTFIDEEDLHELLGQSEDMVEYMFYADNSGFGEHYFISLRSTLSLFCQTLRYYDKIIPFAETITQFSNLINTNKEKFISLEKEEIDLIKGFVNNIDHWLNVLFVTGGADLYFMDNSIHSDFQTIQSIINYDDTQIEDIDLDDIFDF